MKKVDIVTEKEIYWIRYTCNYLHKEGNMYDFFLVLSKQQGQIMRNIGNKGEIMIFSGKGVHRV